VKILKFGGTSVGSTQSLKKVFSIIAAQSDANIVVVASALSGVTNQLIEAGRLASESDESYKALVASIEDKHIQIIKDLIEVRGHSRVVAFTKGLLNELEDLLHGVYLLKELSPRTQDLLLSFGERMSCNLLASLLQQKTIEATYTDARALIRTDNNFGNASVDFSSTYALIREHFASAKDIKVVTGFIGSTAKGETTTLGRGGSDYTAALLAAALGAEHIEIWTDVNGMMTADPRKVRKAFTLPNVSYVEAMEMSHFGAKVIYPPTLQPAFGQQIPIYIKNTFEPEHEGTLISADAGNNEFLIKGISSIDDVALVTLEGSGLVGVAGVAARLFGSLARNHINIILITQASSEHSITFAVLPQFGSQVKAVVEAEFNTEILNGLVQPVQVETERSIVACIGENMRKRAGISAQLYNALGRNGISVAATAQGSSELNISIVISKTDLSKALNALHEAFFLSEMRTLNLFLVGPGLVGGTLLEQIRKQEQYLAEHMSLRINLVGISNSRYMVFDEEGIPIREWQQALEQKSEPMQLGAFVNSIIELNLPNSVVVDCTASKDTVPYYLALLKASIAVVTPNKYANSGSYSEYVELHTVAARWGVEFCYETNVGAGLPVINTLQDLINSGDEILKIEAVLSGSLSFIFNNFKEGVLFSDIVSEAKRRGFTEPDPREDLSGADVARKILILAREAGYELEPEDVKVESFLPQSCLDADTIEGFWTCLRDNDPYFEQLCARAFANGKVLRMVAMLENGEASLAVVALGPEHPFYSLSGSDNMIAFTTGRYNERPLVIRGPGAGAEVTAAGIFAEIIRCSD
jgi:bifunctional aspartokinase / homoserine dehydrogenase 1